MTLYNIRDVLGERAAAGRCQSETISFVTICIPTRSVRLQKAVGSREVRDPSIHALHSSLSVHTVSPIVIDGCLESREHERGEGDLNPRALSSTGCLPLPAAAQEGDSNPAPCRAGPSPHASSIRPSADLNFCRS